MNQENYMPYPSEDQLKCSFAATCISRAADKYKISPQLMYARLQKYGLISKYILKYYDVLHTQSIENAVDDILEALKNRENK